MTEKVTYPQHAQRRLLLCEDHFSKELRRLTDGPNKGLLQAHFAIIVGYCPDTFAYFEALVKDALVSFPKLDPAEITCSKVRNSDYIRGYTLIIFAGPQFLGDWEPDRRTPETAYKPFIDESGKEWKVSYSGIDFGF